MESTRDTVTRNRERASNSTGAARKLLHPLCVIRNAITEFPLTFSGKSGEGIYTMVFSQQVDLPDMESKLLCWLQKKMPRARNISISDMRVAVSGFATRTILFDLGWWEAGQAKLEGMVLRLPPPLPLFSDYDLRRQAGVMNHLKGTGVPVPRVHWLENDENILGAPFLIMARVEGTTVPPGSPSYQTAGIYYDATPEQRAKMWWGFVGMLARIHTLDWEKTGLSFLGVSRQGDQLTGLLDYYEGYLNWVKEGVRESLPTFEASLSWLRRNRYTPERIMLCWGDSRLANTMYSSSFHVTAALDWEVAYLGDPESDLAWFLLLDWHQVEVSGITRLAGSPGLKETLQRYEELTGFKVKNLFYNEVLAPFKLGVILVRLYKNLNDLGIVRLNGNPEANNYFAKRLASLLGLPSLESG